jgi:hypothetical protein
MMLNAILLSFIMLNVVTWNVEAPTRYFSAQNPIFVIVRPALFRADVVDGVVSGVPDEIRLRRDRHRKVGPAEASRRKRTVDGSFEEDVDGAEVAVVDETVVEGMRRQDDGKSNLVSMS